MSVEKGFLDAILREPDDPTHRLVYADWLDEQGDARRAEFLRLEVRLAQQGSETEPIMARLRELLPEIGADWAALLDRTGIVGCRYGSACPGRWEKLGLTLKARVRQCGTCGRFVQHCRQGEEARERLRQGEPVAVESRVELTLMANHLDPMSEPGPEYIQELRDEIARLQGRPRRRRRR